MRRAREAAEAALMEEAMEAEAAAEEAEARWEAEEHAAAVAAELRAREWAKLGPPAQPVARKPGRFPGLAATPATTTYGGDGKKQVRTTQHSGRP